LISRQAQREIQMLAAFDNHVIEQLGDVWDIVDETDARFRDAEIYDPSSLDAYTDQPGNARYQHSDADIVGSFCLFENQSLSLRGVTLKNLVAAIYTNTYFHQ
jgi:hypothetical protein